MSPRLMDDAGKIDEKYFLQRSCNQASPFTETGTEWDNDEDKGSGEHPQ